MTSDLLSVLLILNIEFDVLNFFFILKREAVFLKTGYLQSKNSEQKICCLKIHVYVKNLP